VAGYSGELMQTREMLNSRYDSLKSGSTWLCLMSSLLAVALALLSGSGTLIGQSKPALNADPASFAFTYQLGIAPPPVRILSVTSSGAPLTFHVSLSTSSGGDWLTVGPALDGVTPANLGVFLNPSAIQMNPVGTYNGAITLTGDGASNSGLSVPVTLIVSGSPALTVSDLNPSSAAAGGPAFTLTVNGSGYVPGSTVQWNGSPLTTSYVSGAQLTAPVSASLIATPGSPGVTVVNPGGAASNAVKFTVNSQSGLSIVTGSPLPPGAAATPYSQILIASGGVTPYKGWAATAGSLPPGISVMTPPSGQTGLLSGVPTTPGTYLFTVQVTDSANTTASMQYSLTINPSMVSMSTNGIVNAASYAGGSVAPGEIVLISGSGFGASNLVTLQLDNRGYVSTTLAGVQLLFDGVPAPLIYVQAGRISAVVPYLVDGKTATQVQVSSQGQKSTPVAVPVATVAPGIFTLDASGRGQGAIVNLDGTVNSPGNPAPAGSYVAVYATGEGQTNPAGVDGKPGDTAPPRPIQSVSATVGGVNAQVQYAGGVPGLLAGLSQINVQIPQGIASGSSVPIFLTFGGQPTQVNVTLAVK
jgi:uncharacterized protein (TIGR03437 family)